jgi:hypothetical protein
MLCSRQAISPHYIFTYFVRNGLSGWESLGGIVLAITDMHPPWSSSDKLIVVITFPSCQNRQGASADKLQVKAAKFLPLVGLARSKRDPSNRGHGAPYLYPFPASRGQMLVPRRILTLRCLSFIVCQILLQGDCEESFRAKDCSMPLCCCIFSAF